MRFQMPKNKDQSVRHASHKKTYRSQKDDTLIYALGGLGEVGKNMYCLTSENRCDLCS